MQASRLLLKQLTVSLNFKHNTESYKTVGNLFFGQFQQPLDESRVMSKRGSLVEVKKNLFLETDEAEERRSNLAMTREEAVIHWTIGAFRLPAKLVEW